MAQDYRADKKHCFLLLLTLLGNFSLLHDGILDLVVEQWKHYCKFDAVQLVVAYDHVISTLHFLKRLKRLLLKDTWVYICLHSLNSLVQLFDELKIF